MGPLGTSKLDITFDLTRLIGQVFIGFSVYEFVCNGVCTYKRRHAASSWYGSVEDLVRTAIISWHHKDW